MVARHAAVARSSPPEVALIYTMHEEIRVGGLYYARIYTMHAGDLMGITSVPMRVGSATSQLDLQSLSPLSVAGCG